MAPITDDTVEALRDTIHKLESRVHQLESKLGEGTGSGGKANSALQSVRMILMGPPGAGECSDSLRFPALKLKYAIREGNTSTKDPRKILCLPSGILYPTGLHLAYFSSCL